MSEGVRGGGVRGGGCTKHYNTTSTSHILTFLPLLLHMNYKYICTEEVDEMHEHTHLLQALFLVTVTTSLDWGYSLTPITTTMENTQ